jgi:hypothetical protein
MPAAQEAERPFASWTGEQNTALRPATSPRRTPKVGHGEGNSRLSACYDRTGTFRHDAFARPSEGAIANPSDDMKQTPAGDSIESGRMEKVQSQPASIAKPTVSPTSRLARNRRRQPAGSSMSRARICRNSRAAGSVNAG